MKTWIEISIYLTLVVTNTSPYYNVTNIKVIGKVKDELGGVFIKQFIGFRAKIYSVTSADGKKMKKTKGVKKNVVKQEIKHQLYKDCLFKKEKFMHSLNSFRSEKHVLVTVKQTKNSLSCYDDKR